MGTSAFDILKQQTTNQNPTQPQPTTASAFDLLPKNTSVYPEQPQKEPGFFDRYTNLVKNFTKDYAIPAMEAGAGTPLALDKKFQEMRQQNTTEQSLQLAGSQLGNTFSTKAGLSNVWDETKQAFSQVMDNPSGVIRNMPNSLLDMVNSPIEALIGKDLTTSDGQVLTPQQRADAIKSTAGMVAQGLVTGGISKVFSLASPAGRLMDAVEKAGTAAEFEKAASSGMISDAAKTSPTKVGALAKTLFKGAVEGGAGGATFGLVSGAGDDDQVSKVVGGGLMFAPLGAITHALIGAIPEYRSAVAAQDIASNVQNWRQLQFKYNDNIKNIDTKANAIMTSNDMATAALANGLTDTSKPTVISGVSASVFKNIKADGLGFDVVTTQPVRGKVDAIFSPKELGLNVTKFATTGHYEGEVVSWNGKDYTVRVATPDQSNLEGSDGETKIVPTNELRRTTNVASFDPEAALDQQYQAWKTKNALVLKSPVPTEDPFEGLDNPRKLAFGQRLAQDVMDDADPLNKNIIQNAIKRGQPSMGTFDDFLTHSQTNGYAVDVEDAGKIVFKDMGDPKQQVVASGLNINQATKFLNDSGQDFGSDIVKTFSSPETVSNLGEPPNPNRPEPLGIVDKIDNWWKRFSSVADYTAHWTTPAPDLFKAIDARFGTRFYSQFYDATQAGTTSWMSNADPWISRLSGIQKMLGKVGPDQLHILMGWMETMSPESIIKNGFAKPLSGAEVGTALMLSKRSGGDILIDNKAIQDAFDYNKYLRENPKEDPAAYAQKIGLSSAANLAHNIMQGIRTQPYDETSLGRIVRLARAMNNDDVDRPDYAKQNNMSPQLVAVGTQLDKLFSDLGDKFGIDKNDRITNFMTHARLYEAGDMQGVLNMFARDKDPKAQQFYGAMARTGEIDAYERDPFQATLRYIMSGFKAEHYNPIEANAKTYLENTMSSDMIPGPEKAKVRSIAEGYINDLRGRTPIMSQATESAVNGVLNKILPQSDQPFRDAVVKMLRTVQVGTQGFKVAAGLRDFMNVAGVLYYRFGPERLMSVLEKGMNAKDADFPLIQQGKISGLSFDRLTDPTLGSEDDLSSRLNKAKTLAGDAYTKFQAASLKVSGQEAVYNTMREGAYMDMYSRAAQIFKKVAGGDINKVDAIKELRLDRDFSTPVSTEVSKQLLNSPTNYDAIAQFLGREAARQITPTYGLGNNPYGWGRTIGRVVGQYGSYPMWAIRSMKEATTTGSISDRFMRAARFGVYTGAVMGAGASTGYNFAPWYIHRVGFAGGPLANLGFNLYKATTSTGVEQQQAADAVKQLWPVGPNGPRKEFYIPGSFAIGNMVDAADQGSPLPLMGIQPQKP